MADRPPGRRRWTHGRRAAEPSAAAALRWPRQDAGALRARAGRRRRRAAGRACRPQLAAGAAGPARRWSGADAAAAAVAARRGRGRRRPGAHRLGRRRRASSARRTRPSPVRARRLRPRRPRSRAARRQLGLPYAWGGGGAAGPGPGIDPDAGVVGFDCSGLTQYAYAQAGISHPAQQPRPVRGAAQGVRRATCSRATWCSGRATRRDPATIHHVAIYLGGGQVLQAPESGDVVKVVADVRGRRLRAARCGRPAERPPGAGPERK